MQKKSSGAVNGGGGRKNSGTHAGIRRLGKAMKGDRDNKANVRLQLAPRRSLTPFDQMGRMMPDTRKAGKESKQKRAGSEALYCAAHDKQEAFKLA